MSANTPDPMPYTVKEWRDWRNEHPDRWLTLDGRNLLIAEMDPEHAAAALDACDLSGCPVTRKNLKRQAKRGKNSND